MDEQPPPKRKTWVRFLQRLQLCTVKKIMMQAYTESSTSKGGAMMVYRSQHPHPLRFRSLVRNKDEIHLVLHCEVCDRDITFKVPSKEPDERKKV